MGTGYLGRRGFQGVVRAREVAKGKFLSRGM